jgi:hypothetical protein
MPIREKILMSEVIFFAWKERPWRPTRTGQRSVLRYWVWVFILIAVGVGAMFVLSSFGGIGGRSGHSMWWGVLILPYPVGWLMAVAGGFVGLVRFFRARSQAVQV